MSVARKTISSPCSVVMDLCTCIKCAITWCEGRFKIRLLRNQYSSTGFRLYTIESVPREGGHFIVRRENTNLFKASLPLTTSTRARTRVRSKLAGFLVIHLVFFGGDKQLALEMFNIYYYITSRSPSQCGGGRRCSLRWSTCRGT